jgi:hypothetical protein
MKKWSASVLCDCTRHVFGVDAQAGRENHETYTHFDFRSLVSLERVSKGGAAAMDIDKDCGSDECV